ncbi:PREDICTED: gap junction delta-4 protein [Ceratotherium simum simum]|uniref:Gap junction protein n=1 Tax=Ceratotherium simum simum TaxID=73337 RepID=A0ABM0HEP3_CERSS|nr:PREDICTED: gap junction delta-4 protein [Ceratotherium simum simum]
MERLDLLGFLIVTLNCNVTIVGKIWLIFTILLRMVVVVLAGAPVYQDEQERFVCNTLQPGCANVCFDIFSPVSHLRFWLIQSVSVLLPSAVFSVYVLHKGAVLAARGPCAPEVRPRGHDPSDPIAGDRRCPPPCRKARNLNVPDFSSGYMVHLFLRTLTEAAFGALHYLLFGFLVPKRFSCTRPPCSSVVDCYVSRPTEKSIMMLFLWAVSALSLLLSVADLACSRIARPTMLPGAPAGGAASRQGTGGPREPPLDPRLRETELAQVPGSPLEPRLACTRTELPDLVQRRERSAQGPCESPCSGRAGERHRECGRCTSIGSCKP